MPNLKQIVIVIAAVCLILIGLLLPGAGSDQTTDGTPANSTIEPGEPKTGAASNSKSVGGKTGPSPSFSQSGNPTADDADTPAATLSRYDELLALIDSTAQSPHLNGEQLASILRAADLELRGTERVGIFNQVAGLVAERDPDLGLELVKDLQSLRDRHNFVKAIIETSIKGNPMQAADWAAKLDEPALQTGAFNVIGMKWAETDLDASSAWAAALQNPQLKTSAMEGLAWTWAQEDPDAAYAWAAQLEEPEIRDSVFVKIAKMISVKDPRQGSEWALQFPEGPGRNSALDYAVFQWASKDLAGAADWVSNVQDPELRANSLVAIARSWSTQDPKGATAWASDIPDAESRAAALITTSRKWAETDPAGAARWLEGLADPIMRDHILKSVTSSLSDSNPQTAATWLNSIQEPGLRSTGEGVATFKLIRQNEKIRADSNP